MAQMPWSGTWLLLSQVLAWEWAFQALTRLSRTSCQLQFLSAGWLSARIRGTA